MKPTLQQKQWLKDYLYQVMNYRETYEEVYDHVLAALEDKQEAEFFETTVAEVIADEFGGNNELMEMEERCKNAVVRDAFKQYVGYWRTFFKFPGIAYIIGLFVIIHYARYFGRHIFLMPIFSLFIVLLPFMLLVTRTIVKKYKLGNNKSTFKDQFFKTIVFRGFLIFFIFNIVHVYLFYWVYNLACVGPFLQIQHRVIILSAISEFISNSVLIALIIHNLACFKLFRDELNTDMVTR
jgi:hypothetical protein